MVWVLWLATCCNPQLCASEHRDVGKGEAKGKVGKISRICQQEGGKRNLDPGGSQRPLQHEGSSAAALGRLAGLGAAGVLGIPAAGGCEEMLLRHQSLLDFLAAFSSLVLEGKICCTKAVLWLCTSLSVYTGEGCGFRAVTTLCNAALQSLRRLCDSSFPSFSFLGLPLFPSLGLVRFSEALLVSALVCGIVQ